jgi:alpha-N-arabinofuranosidase
MKAADPKVELVMIGYNFGTNLKDMLEIAGQYIDLVTDRSGSEPALKNDLEVIGDYNKTHGTNIRLCNTEWLARNTGFGAAAEALRQRQVNTRMSRQQGQISWNYAMNTVYQLFTFQRLGNDFLWSNFNNLASTWGQNIIECPKDTIFISCVGRVYELMSKSKSAWVLKTDTLTNVNGIFVQSTTNTARDKLIFYVLNYFPTQSQVSLDLSDFKVTGKDAVVKSVNAEGPLVANTTSNFKKVSSSEQVVKVTSPKKPVFTVKPWSVTEITLSL